MPHKNLLTNFILNREIDFFRLNDKLNLEKDNLRIIQEQEGNIPALFENLTGDIYYEISCLDHVIQRICIFFDYEVEKQYTIAVDKGIWTIGYFTSLEQFKKILQSLKIDWALDDESEGATYILKLSTGIKCMFYDDENESSLIKMYVENEIL